MSPVFFSVNYKVEYRNIICNNTQNRKIIAETDFVMKLYMNIIFKSEIINNRLSPGMKKAGIKTQYCSNFPQIN